MATAYPARRRRARESAAPRPRAGHGARRGRNGQGARRPTRVMSDVVGDVHCGSKMVHYTVMRWSHAFFKWITRELHAPGAPGFRSTKPALAADQIFYQEPPMFHLMVSRNPGERNCDEL